MKQFIKYVFATMVGIFIIGVIISLSFIFGIVGMAATEGAATSVEENSVLVIKLEGSIEERTEENPFAMLSGSKKLEKTGLDNILTAIQHAKTEDNVKGIYIEAGSFEGAMPSTLQEIRNALVDFKKDGKFIVSYGDNYSQGEYYLSSVADSIIINPQGMVEWSGLSSQVIYFKDLLEKVGVEMQVVKVGTYKSAVEPFLLNEISEANREQITTYNNEIWSEMTKAVSKSRGISAEKLNQLADSAIILSPTATFKKEKLVDKIAYSDEVPQIIANMMHLDDPDDYHTISVNDLAGIADSEPKGTSGNIIAVYYAVGDIVDQPSDGFNTDPEIAGTKVIQDLKALADDDDVKAVVLRVNSGGGSAYASEQIWHQVKNIKAKKPIIVSMGDMAASGGYYISCAADYIYAEPTTLTGSIGIFGTFVNAGELLNDKLGVHVSTVNTNQYSDIGNTTRPFTEQERNLFQRYINNGYDLFTKRCADGRKMKQDSIKAIGEGRVWTGLHAKQIGLVDELGGIDKAIAMAKKRAKVTESTVICYPAKKDFFEDLMDNMSSDSYADAQMKQTLGEYYSIYSQLRHTTQHTGIQASMPYWLKFNL